MRQPGNPTSMGHRTHPLLGQEVIDTNHGDRVGILRAVAPDVDTAGKPAFVPYYEQRDRRPIDDEPCFAWLAPPTGGLEWKTDVGAIKPA